ncbi:DUF6049 family protein [Actinotalea sp. M2MS4P-6]|uniref:DUF6049 family protein n=1 Tax=Actinotalea sp. M2MS4P-6 TaxID=2983762 RepID=UPI0021E4BF04|nr:DUF6049 family protein [Actinotalea sp. M2MS4P-6]MCV2392853.1 DUF6049 family protein [Actinotalea sp. M2MS4P-6]
MSRPRSRARLGAVTAVLAALLLPASAVAAGAVGIPDGVTGAVASNAASSGIPNVLRTETSPTVQVSITDLSPTVLTPRTDLTITVKLTNAGSTDLAQPRVLVHLNRSGFVSRSSLDLWRDAGPYESLGATVLTQDLDQPLAAGQSRTVTLTVPASSIALPSNSWSWGARGLGLELVDVADATRLRQGVARTFIVWYPVQNDQHTSVSVIVPVTGPAPGEDAARQVSRLTSPGGRLGDLLAATDSPAVTWAVDPWLLSTALDSDAESSTGPGPASWARSLATASADQGVVTLPWGDADVTALVHDGAESLLTLAEQRSASRVSELGLEPTTELVLPAESLPDLTVAAWAAGEGRPLVVGPGELPAPSVLTYTPSGQTTVATAAGDAVVLVPDARLSSALTTGTVLGTGTAGNDAAPTGATAAADLLAELAVITRERPADPRHMLLSVPRDWDPDVEVVRAELSALEEAPFVAIADLNGLASAASDIERGTLPATISSDAEVSAVTLGAVDDAVNEREALSTMASHPEELLGDLDAERLAPAALAWREDPAGRTTLVNASMTRTAELRDAVTVPETSDVNLLSSSGELPLQVANALDQDVTLGVRLQPSDARLVARETVEVLVPAESTMTVQIPVHGVQSGNVAVTVQLLTPDGVLVNDSTTLTVRVRAEWESIGTAIIFGVLALGLVTGLVRTIRRGRGRGRAARAATAATTGGAEGAEGAGT